MEAARIAVHAAFLPGGATTVTGSQYLLDPKIKNLGCVTKIRPGGKR
jgi:hypothetical protein